MKACDSVEWDFLLLCLVGYGVPDRFIRWIEVCITSPRFSVAVNGNLVGFFEGKRGLGQGDHLSPYLFVLAMEVLSRLLEEAALVKREISFHPRCEKFKITHLCFTDNLLNFQS
jgi:hypothetical protein